MSTLSRVLAKEVDKSLATHGFHRQGKNWYRRTEETTVVFHLLKGRWANEYSGGIGVLFKAVDDIPIPKVYECHWTGNLVAGPIAWRSEPIIVTEALGTVAHGEEFQGQGEFVRALQEHGLPMMLEAGSVAGFARLLESGQADRLTVKGRALHLFGHNRSKTDDAP